MNKLLNNLLGMYKQAKLNKKAEEDLIEVGWGLDTSDEDMIESIAEDTGRQINKNFWEKINKDIDKVESWFLRKGYKNFFTKVRDEGHGKYNELGGTAWMTKQQLEDYISQAEKYDENSYMLLENTGSLYIDINHDDALEFNLFIYVDDKDLDELGIESKRVSKNKKLSSKAKAMRKRADLKSNIEEFDKAWEKHEENFFKDYKQTLLTEYKGNLTKATQDLINSFERELPKETLYKLLKEYIDRPSFEKIEEKDLQEAQQLVENFNKTNNEYEKNKKTIEQKIEQRLRNIYEMGYRDYKYDKDSIKEEDTYWNNLTEEEKQAYYEGVEAARTHTTKHKYNAFYWKQSSKTNRLQKKAVLQVSENGMGYVLPNGQVVYPGDEAYVKSELKGDKELLEKTKAKIIRLEKAVEEIKKEYPNVDLSKYPDSALFKLDRELKLKETLELCIETEEDILNAFKENKLPRQATKKQADNGQKKLINAWYYHKIGDKYVREKIADRQSVYLKYPENEEDRYTLIDDVKDKLKSYARWYFKPEKGSKLGDKIVITDYSTDKDLGEIEYNENYISAKKHKTLNKQATIKHENGVYNVYSESGKCLGKGYKTKEEAEKRLKQVEYFKNKKAKWAEEQGTDFYGPVFLPNEDKGIFRIKYYGGPGKIEYLRKAKNGKYHWVDQTQFDYQDDKPFETTDYELVKKLVDQFGGKPEKVGTKQVNNKRTSLKQVVISKMAKIKK